MSKYFSSKQAHFNWFAKKFSKSLQECKSSLLLTCSEAPWSGYFGTDHFCVNGNIFGPNLLDLTGVSLDQFVDLSGS